MAALALNFLGELEVVRDGEALSLPPSKKTRALLAYLALQPRSFRRETLCELLWEIPDDPRGSLRWSLSKLRRLVDDDRRRIVADRSSVAFDATGVDVDCRRLESVADQAADASTEVLEQAAAAYRGHFLEGLELSNFHDFHAWCLGERERAVRAQSTILGTLVERLSDDPERAVPHARALVSADPYDESVRASLVRLLVSLRQLDEAEQQYQLGRRVLTEAGIEPTGALYAAWRGAPGRSRQAAPRPAPVPPPAVPPSVVGRDEEIGLIAELMRRVAAEQRSELVLVSGAAGMGKSRLLETTAGMAEEAGAFVLKASAFESEAIRPFALWIDALRRLGDDCEPAVFDTAHRDNRDRLFGALSDLVHARSLERPVVLLFDDIQWCDESSAAALHYVARLNAGQPVLGVLAGRDDELHDNAAVQQALRGLRHEGMLHELKLGPLPESAVRTLVRQHAPGADGERLSRQCAGNPLLVIELARAESAGDSGESLDQLVRERLDRFDVDTREVLQWASVLSPRIEVTALTRMTGLGADQVAAALEQAERQALLSRGDGGFLFVHDLLGRAVYAEIPPTRRQIMHRRVAEQLEQDTAVDLAHAADLAHHASQSGEAALAARAMVSAGRLCLRFFANEEALSLARKGLNLAERLPAAERVQLEIELNDVMLTAGPVEDWEAAVERYVALAERALDHGALGHARLGYHMASYLRWSHGHWSGAREQTLQAARIARSGSGSEHIVGMAETAKCLAMLERDLSNADAMLMEARALAEREGMSHPAIPAALGMLRFHENRLDEAEELFQEARTACKSAGDRINEFQANEYLAMIAFERGRFDDARRHCRALLDIGERLRGGSEGPFARAMDGLCRYAIDDDPGPMDEALVDLVAADAKFRLAYTLTRAALLDVERGRPDRAIERAEAALSAARTLERATEMMLAHAALATAYRARGDDQACRRHADALDGFEQAPVARWARARAEGMMEFVA